MLFTTGPDAGSPPKNVRLAQDSYLLDVIGGTFDLLYFSVDGTVPESIRQCVQHHQSQGLPLRLLVISAQTVVEPQLEVDQYLHDPNQRVALHYGLHTAGGAYLFRPDQHICGRWVNVDATRLNHALQSLFTQ